MVFTIYFLDYFPLIFIIILSFTEQFLWDENMFIAQHGGNRAGLFDI